MTLDEALDRVLAQSRARQLPLHESRSPGTMVHDSIPPKDRQAWALVESFRTSIKKDHPQDPPPSGR